MEQGKGRIYPRAFEGQAPREFGQDANILKTRTFNLAAARNLEEIEIGGSCLWALTATSLGASIDIFINDQLRDPITFQQGMFLRGIPFSRVFVSHAAQAGETITIFFAVEQDIRNIEIVNPAIAFTEVNLTKSTALFTPNDVALAAAATTNLRAASAIRRSLNITNLAVNLNIIRIGDVTASATKGIELAPGETLYIENTDSIYAWNPGPIQSVGLTILRD